MTSTRSTSSHPDNRHSISRTGAFWPLLRFFLARLTTVALVLAIARRVNITKKPDIWHLCRPFFCVLLIAATACTPQHPLQGQSFPELELNGERLERSWFERKVTLVNLWATWCKPCREELPALQRMASELDVQLLLISYDLLPETANQYLETTLPGAGSWHDPSQTSLTTLQTRGLPTTFIVGRDTRIAAVLEGDQLEKLDALRERLIALKRRAP